MIVSLGSRIPKTNKNVRTGSELQTVRNLEVAQSTEVDKVIRRSQGGDLACFGDILTIIGETRCNSRGV